MPALEIPMSAPDAVATCIGACLKTDVAMRTSFKQLVVDLEACLASDAEDGRLASIDEDKAMDSSDPTDIPWGEGIGEIVQIGWLIKQGGGRSALGRASWKRRWFVLRDNGSLAYFRTTRPDAKPLGVILLPSASSVVLETPVEATFAESFCFAITTRERIYHLVAATKEERATWVKLINSAIQALGQRRK